MTQSRVTPVKQLSNPSIETTYPGKPGQVSHLKRSAPQMRALLLAIAALVTGCDHIHGVARYTDPMPSAPPARCVQDAVSSVEGVKNVSYSWELGSRPLTLHGIEKPDQVHRFWYEYKGIKSNLYFVARHDGSATYHHSYGCLNCTPPQSTIDTLYPGMRAIDEAIKLRCGVSAPIQESCSGGKCGGA